MNENTNMDDYTSKEFEEGFSAWCDMKALFSNPYEKHSFDWVEWTQGWKDASGWK